MAAGADPDALAGVRRDVGALLGAAVGAEDETTRTAVMLERKKNFFFSHTDLFFLRGAFFLGNECGAGCLLLLL